MKLQLLLLTALLFTSICLSQEKIDIEVIDKIKNEGFNNSQVEHIAFNLIDKSGPRLTNSNGFERAANYAVQQFSEWGLTNINKEPWGEFGRGWEVNKSYIAMTKPYYMPFIAIPKSWTGSTDGAISGKVVFLDDKSEGYLSKYKGKLKGAIVAILSDDKQELTFKADATRFTEEELKKMEEPISTRRFTPEELAKFRARFLSWKNLNNFLVDEGVSLILQGVYGKHGTLFTSISANSLLENTLVEVSELDVAAEYIGLMNRLIKNGVDVEIEAEVETTFNTEILQVYNVIAEIQGTDENLKSEIVMLGAHLDSWHGATGATDNGAGCTVMMEAVRILKAIGIKPKRTIRIALWGGEEQGWLGSYKYIKDHFGDSKTMQLTKEHEKISAYYNIDNGTGRIRGIYLEGNEAVRPIFKQWFSLFDDIIDHTTISIRGDTGGTDHMGFNAIGIPGFQFIQDPIEYHTRTHHTNMDNYERLVIDDLKQMAVIVASFVYNTAQRDEKLPRKPLKKGE